MKIKKLTTRRRSDAVLEYARAVTRGQHVTPKAGEWQVKKTGAAKATKLFENQKDAIEFAKKIAKKQEAELFIHSRSGQIRERNSYGSDDFPPRG
jgi:Uncharacterized protein conserved in bacteria (DUF2188)